MVRSFWSQKNFAAVVPVQGRILVAILALLGASMATAATPEEIATAKYASAWKLTQPMKLAASISMGPNYANPTYFLHLKNGEVIDLPPQTLANLSGLTNNELRDAAEQTRVILEGVSNILLSAQNANYAVVRDKYVVAITPDQLWLKGGGYKSFDPLTVVGEENPLGLSEADVVLPGDDATALSNESQTKESRLRRVYSFLRDAVYISTIKAFKNHRAGNDSMKGTIQEWGIQIAFRGELQLGIGKRNFTRNFPMMLSIGYNRAKRTMVFRRGYRKETMADGVGMLAGWKIEFRRYRLFADGADAADPRPNYAKLKGQSWYPPSIPVFSPVADSAPGYQSEGFAIGASIQNMIVPQTLFFDIPMALLNTVTSFEETQRVYSAPIPDPALWMKRFHDQLASSNIFSGPTAAVRCEALFSPMPLRRTAR